MRAIGWNLMFGCFGGGGDGGVCASNGITAHASSSVSPNARAKFILVPLHQVLVTDLKEIYGNEATTLRRDCNGCVTGVI
jgi:hypothetical protein